MPIPTSITDLSTTESANSPQGGDPVGGNIDNYFRAYAAILKKSLSKGAFGLSTASTLPIPADGLVFTVDIVAGTVNAFANVYDGKTVILHFTGVCTLVHSANLVLPTGGNISTISGDIAMFTQLSTGVWVCVSWDRASAAIAVAQSSTILDAYKLVANNQFADVSGDTFTGTVSFSWSGGSTLVQNGVIELQAPSTPFIDWKTNPANDYEFRMVYIGGSGEMQFQKSGGATISFLGDGNIHSPAFGFLSNELASKQPAGNYATKDVGNTITFHWNNGLFRKIDASGYVQIWDASNFNPNDKVGFNHQISHAVGVVQSAPMVLGNPGTFDMGNPWVMSGIQMGASGNASAMLLRFVWLRT